MRILEIIGIVVIAVAILYGRFYKVIEFFRRKLQKRKERHDA